MLIPSYLVCLNQNDRGSVWLFLLFQQIKFYFLFLSINVWCLKKSNMSVGILCTSMWHSSVVSIKTQHWKQTELFSLTVCVWGHLSVERCGSGRDVWTEPLKGATLVWFPAVFIELNRPQTLSNHSSCQAESVIDPPISSRRGGNEVLLTLPIPNSLHFISTCLLFTFSPNTKLLYLRSKLLSKRKNDCNNPNQ